MTKLKQEKNLESISHCSHAELEAMDIDELDRIAFGCNEGDILLVDPNKLAIKYPCDMDNPEYRFKLEGMKWVNSVSFDEPIQVSIGNDGRMYLEDGHHRRFAAIKKGVKLEAEIEIRGNPILRIQEQLKVLHAAKPKIRNTAEDQQGPGL